MRLPDMRMGGLGLGEVGGDLVKLGPPIIYYYYYYYYYCNYYYYYCYYYKYYYYNYFIKNLILLQLNQHIKY